MRRLDHRKIVFVALKDVIYREEVPTYILDHRHVPSQAVDEVDPQVHALNQAHTHIAVRS